MGELRDTAVPSEPAGAAAPPFRFRRPLGWPEPSAEWVALHQLWEPPEGWSPAPGLPAAPRGWRFWTRDRAAMLAFLGPSWSAARRARWIAAVVFLAGDVVTAVGAASRGPFVIASGAILVGGVRLIVAHRRVRRLAGDAVERIATDARSWRAWAVPQRARRRADALGTPWLTDDQAVTAWSAEAWGTSTASAFVEPGRTTPTQLHERLTRRRRWDTVGATVVVAVTALVVAAGLVVPALPSPAHGPVTAAGRSGGPGTADGTRAGGPAPRAEDDVHVTDVPDADVGRYCDPSPTLPGATDDGGCWAWTLSTTTTCRARVEVGFADTATGVATRLALRFVDVPAGVPVVLVESGNEAYAGVQDVICHEVRPSLLPVSVDGQVPAAAYPDACSTLGCVGFRLTPHETCPMSTITIGVASRQGGQDDRRVVESEPLTDGTPTTAFVGGVGGGNAATIRAITCGGV
ncbi:hypothetical protein [Curtobacterium sp. MCBD17_003]|uniref:hypothetical protein n=1 Tax=Curtobacterium sp. MCBD17_003 TaxID=2175667 RepID=UPI000DA9BAC3|nr:hypothetical protein [Curtobacterium sp. MCBD17_003]WIE53525.1 hypothetical protein DEI88_010210 [Curtobacterium sp. MCBD17_003]